jgi:hypothetical protein
VREWWRWTLRGVAVLALAAGGVLLGLHPSARFNNPQIRYPLGNDMSITQCLSPFNRLTGDSRLLPPGPPSAQRLNDARLVACSPVTNSREHIVEALGGGAILLVGVSFLPRRRALVTKRSLEPSPV